MYRSNSGLNDGAGPTTLRLLSSILFNTMSNTGRIAQKNLNRDLLTMLITVYSSKHHLILVWIFFLNYIRSLLKNRMQHLAEAAPVDRTQNCNFKKII